MEESQILKNLGLDIPEVITCYNEILKSVDEYKIKHNGYFPHNPRTVRGTAIYLASLITRNKRSQSEIVNWYEPHLCNASLCKCYKFILDKNLTKFKRKQINVILNPPAKQKVGKVCNKCKIEMFEDYIRITSCRNKPLLYLCNKCYKNVIKW